MIVTRGFGEGQMVVTRGYGFFGTPFREIIRLTSAICKSLDLTSGISKILNLTSEIF